MLGLSTGLKYLKNDFSQIVNQKNTTKVLKNQLTVITYQSLVAQNISYCILDLNY